MKEFFSEGWSGYLLKGWLKPPHVTSRNYWPMLKWVSTERVTCLRFNFGRQGWNWNIVSWELVPDYDLGWASTGTPSAKRWQNSFESEVRVLSIFFAEKFMWKNEVCWKPALDSDLGGGVHSICLLYGWSVNFPMISRRIVSETSQPRYWLQQDMNVFNIPYIWDWLIQEKTRNCGVSCCSLVRQVIISWWWSQYR